MSFTVHLWLFLLGELTDVYLVAIALYTAHLGQIGGAGDVAHVARLEGAGPRLFRGPQHASLRA